MLGEIKKNKRGLSEMIGYVLLVGMAISLSIIVFIWLRRNIPTQEEFCPDDMALIVESYNCIEDLKIVVKNQGLFNISGFVIKGSYAEGVRPLNGLEYTGPIWEEGNHEGVGGTFLEREQGIIYFPLSLAPGQKYGHDENQDLKFWIDDDTLYSILIEPFIIEGEGENKKRVLCDNAIIIQEVSGCTETA